MSHVNSAAVSPAINPLMTSPPPTPPGSLSSEQVAADAKEKKRIKSGLAAAM